MLSSGATALNAIPVNDLSRALAEQADELTDLVRRTIASGWLVHGPEHGAFEHDLASYVGVREAVGVASGTDALELAMRALSPPGRRVVVTVANAGGYATVAARRAGLAVRYCDVDPLTHCVDLSSLEQVMDEQVAVVVLTHLYGRMADAAAARAIAVRWGARLLEDCAQSIGAQHSGRMAGSWGDAAAFSFYPTKNLGALGDGGAVVTSDGEVADRVRALRQYGWTSKYHTEVDGGRNSRLDELQAAVLRFRLPRVSEWNARRRAVLGTYASRASGRIRVLPAPDPSHAAHLAVVQVDDVPGAAALREHLRGRGIGSDVHYPVPDHRQPAFAPEGAVRLPATERLIGRTVTLPCFPELHDDEVVRIGDALDAF